jgi:hypothetical protein
VSTARAAIEGRDRLHALMDERNRGFDYRKAALRFRPLPSSFALKLGYQVAIKLILLKLTRFHVDRKWQCC